MECVFWFCFLIFGGGGGGGGCALSKKVLARDISVLSWGFLWI